MKDQALEGEKRTEVFENKLEPKNLVKELRVYQTYFGKDFTFRDLLYLKEINARAMIAAAICDMKPVESDAYNNLCFQNG